MEVTEPDSQMDFESDSDDESDEEYGKNWRRAGLLCAS